MKSEFKLIHFHSQKCIWKCRLENVGHIASASMCWIHFYGIIPCCWFIGIKASVNSLRPRQNRRHFADAIFKCTFLNENVWILIKISLKFVPKGPINNTPSLVQIMAWCRPGDKPLYEPMMARLPMLICVTQSVKSKYINTFEFEFMTWCFSLNYNRHHINQYIWGRRMKVFVSFKGLECDLCLTFCRWCASFIWSCYIRPCYKKRWLTVPRFS